MASKNITKRPHFVPASYLRAWADSGDQVAVRRRRSAEVYTPNVINVAVQAGIYGQGEEGQAREEKFGLLEQMWPQLRNELITQSGGVGAEARAQITMFVAVQLMRTRERVMQMEFLNSFAEYSSRRPVEKGDIRAFLAERWLQFSPCESEVEGAWTFACAILNEGEPPGKDEIMEVLFKIAVHELAPRLSEFHWTVEHCRKPILFTSDRPVMNWRPRNRRGEFQGAGIMDADEVRFPLGPKDLLVMRRTGKGSGFERVQPRRFERINSAVASQCHEFVVAAPSRARELELLLLATHRPVLRFDMGLGVQELPDGRERSMGDILHMWMPTHADHA